MFRTEKKNSLHEWFCDKSQITLDVMWMYKINQKLKNFQQTSYQLLSNFSLCLCCFYRYSREKYSFAVTGSREAFDLSYWRKVNRDLQIGSSLACSHREGKAIGTVYYRIERPDCTIRGLFDSDWSVGFTYQRWVWQGEASFNLFIFADFVMPENISLANSSTFTHSYLHVSPNRPNRIKHWINFFPVLFSFHTRGATRHASKSDSGRNLRTLFSDLEWNETKRRKLSEMPVGIGISLLFCIPKNTFQCGFKIDLDSNLV